VVSDGMRGNWRGNLLFRGGKALTAPERRDSVVAYPEIPGKFPYPGATPAQVAEFSAAGKYAGLHQRRQRPRRHARPRPARCHPHPGHRLRRPVQGHPARRRAEAHHPPGRFGLPGHLDRPSDTANTMTGGRVVILADPAATSQAVARAVAASARTAAVLAARLPTADWERRMRGGIRRSRGRAPASARAGWRRPEAVEHEVGDVAAELLTGHEVDHGVLPGEDPAECGLVGGGLEAAEGPGHAGICV
jgi:hypothetical protein